MDHSSAAFHHALVQPAHPVLEFLKSFLAEGIIDPVVHAVAGDDDVRFGLLQHPVESLVQIRPWESSARVVGFGEPGNGFAGKP